MRVLVVIASLCTILALPMHPITESVGNDPATSWLTYAVAKGGGKTVTYMNATWTVPSYPTQKVEGNAPGFWYGIEPEPAAYLIQPILAWGYAGVEYTIFNGYYQWNDNNWWHSPQTMVTPGQTIVSSLTYQKSSNSYTMYIGCKETGKGVTSSRPVLNQQTYTDVYFVLEHQPDDCQQLPSNGFVEFQDIYIEWDGNYVVPKWQSSQFKPACNSTTQVVSSSDIKITWATS